MGSTKGHFAEWSGAVKDVEVRESTNGLAETDQTAWAVAVLYSVASIPYTTIQDCCLACFWFIRDANEMRHTCSAFD